MGSRRLQESLLHVLSFCKCNVSSALSPSNIPPLAQKIRSDLQISEESLERELLRTQPTLMKSPSPSSPRGFLPPSPLAFTPTKIQAEQVAEMSNPQCKGGSPLLTVTPQDADVGKSDQGADVGSPLLPVTPQGADVGKSEQGADVGKSDQGANVGKSDQEEFEKLRRNWGVSMKFISRRKC